MDAQKTPNYVRVALQSAVAAALCLGMPAGLLLWLILLQQFIHAEMIDRTVTFLQGHGLISILILVVCSLLWSFLLARISRYPLWWHIGIATMLGITAGWFSPLSNLDGVFADRFPLPTLYAVAMCGLVWVVTALVGLAYGFVLRNIKAALVMGFTTSLVATLAMLLTILLFDQFGIYVGGTVPLAMSKVTVTGLLTSALMGGMVLGVGFTKFRYSSLLSPEIHYVPKRLPKKAL